MEMAEKNSMLVNRWSEDNPARTTLEHGRKRRIRGSIWRTSKPITYFNVQKIPVQRNYNVFLRNLILNNETPARKFLQKNIFCTLYSILYTQSYTKVRKKEEKRTMYSRHTQHHRCEDSIRALLCLQPMQEDCCHFINALCNHTNAVSSSDTFHTILGTEQSNSYSDDNNFFWQGSIKKEGYPITHNRRCQWWPRLPAADSLPCRGGCKLGWLSFGMYWVSV